MNIIIYYMINGYHNAMSWQWLMAICLLINNDCNGMGKQIQDIFNTKFFDQNCVHVHPTLRSPACKGFV